MKCPICNLVEMFVMNVSNGEMTFVCPKCGQEIRQKIVEPETPNAEEVKIELSK